MTPQEIETAARRQYNAVGDSNWSQAEIFDIIYRACLELARECLPIERTYQTSTVASQQEYTFPENAIAIRRITYNGQKLLNINFREDDALTLDNSATASTGTPQYYYIWNETIALRPIPAEVGTLKIYAFSEPQQILTSSTTIEIPSIFHADIVYFVLSEMAAKDLNFQASKHYLDKWFESKVAAKRWQQKRKRRDSYTSVMDEETLPTTILGTV